MNETLLLLDLIVIVIVIMIISLYRKLFKQIEEIYNLKIIASLLVVYLLKNDDKFKEFIKKHNITITDDINDIDKFK